MGSIITLNQLSISRGNSRVLSEFTAEVSSGDVIGILGLNGAGKTSLLESILGFIPSSDNQITLFDAVPQRMSNEIKQRIGFVPQKDELPANLRGQAYLQLISGFYQNFDLELALELASQWQLDLSKKMGSLSVGQRQKLSILAEIAHHPQLLILDEPVASLDPVARREFLQTISSIACEPSNAILFSTHIVSDLERVANRVWMIKDGKLLLDMPLDDLKEQIQVVEFSGAIDSTPLPGELARRSPLGATRVCLRHADDDFLDHLEASKQIRPKRLDLNLEDLMLEIHS